MLIPGYFMRLVRLKLVVFLMRLETNLLTTLVCNEVAVRCNTVNSIVFQMILLTYGIVLITQTIPKEKPNTATEMKGIDINELNDRGQYPAY